jgi:predicted metal-binding protein
MTHHFLYGLKMSLSEYFKCPGPDSSKRAFPEITPCPDCGGEVEIWTDEIKGKCPDCGRIVRIGNLQPDDETERKLNELVRLACQLGATDVKIISADDVRVENGLADLCNESQCEHYGLSPSCPPHVSGPPGFRELRKKVQYAMALRISVSTAVLMSDERREIMRLLHEVAAGIEQAAVRAGYHKSKAFAGGSCKKIFCHDRKDCRVLSKDGECRYPLYARPSMSGFGINVSELMKLCGWPADINANESEADADSTSWVAGLILIG